MIYKTCLRLPNCLPYFSLVNNWGVKCFHPVRDNISKFKFIALWYDIVRIGYVECVLTWDLAIINYYVI